MADKFVTFQIDEEVKEKAEELAKERGVSFSAFIRILIIGEVRHATLDELTEQSQKLGMGYDTNK